MRKESLRNVMDSKDLSSIQRKSHSICSLPLPPTFLGWFQVSFDTYQDIPVELEELNCENYGKNT